MPVANVGTIPVMQPMPLPVDNSNQGQAARQQLAAFSRPETKKVKPQVISSAAADLEKLVFNRKLQFVVDHHSNQVIVKVIDKETDKVIKELPPEELQRLHRNLRETIGFLFDERV